MAERRRPPCPICGRPSQPATAPFCSPRCAQVDLGRWLGGDYAIPGEDAPGEGPREGEGPPER